MSFIPGDSNFVTYSPRDNRETLEWEIIRLFRGLTHQSNAHFPTPGQ